MDVVEILLCEGGDVEHVGPKAHHSSFDDDQLM